MGIIFLSSYIFFVQTCFVSMAVSCVHEEYATAAAGYNMTSKYLRIDDGRLKI